MNHTRITQLAFFFITWIFFMFRFGYDYAATDHDEMLPYLKAVMNPTLYTQDVMVQHLADGLNVRTIFVYVLRMLCFIFPVWLAVALGYAMIWCAILHFTFRIALALTNSNFVGYFTVFVNTVLLHKLTFGANELLYNELLPESVAWALVLAALLQFWQEKWFKSGALLGLATLFHLVTGITVTLSLGLVLVWHLFQGASRHVSWRNVCSFGGIFLLIASPLLIAIFLQQLAYLNTESVPSRFYLVSALRLPHHHLFFSFPAFRVIPFLICTFFGISAFLWFKHNKVADLNQVPFLQIFGIITILLWVFALVFTELFPVLFVAKLQLFKLAVLIKLFAVILIARALEYYWRQHFQKKLDQFLAAQTPLPKDLLRKLVWGFALTFMIVFALQLNSEHGFLYRRIYSLPHAKSDLGKVETWIRANTPPNTLFAIPPSNTTFRSRAERSIVVNWLLFPFEDALMPIWYERLQTLAPFSPPQRGYTMPPKLDTAFYQHLPKQLPILKKKYGIHYILVEERYFNYTLFPENTLKRRKQINNWNVYEVLK